MKETLRIVTGAVAGLAILACAICIVFLCFKGGVWLSERLLPIVAKASGYVFLGCLFILIPLAVFHPTRGWAGAGLYGASYLFGAALWMSGLLLTHSSWGITGVLVGLLLCGVGVVPLAMIATLLEGLWQPFIALILMAVATYGTRFMGAYAMQKYEEGEKSTARRSSLGND